MFRKAGRNVMGQRENTENFLEIYLVRCLCNKKMVIGNERAQAVDEAPYF